MKKFLAVILALTMIFSLGVTAFADGEEEEAVVELIDTAVASSIREGAEIPTYITLPADYDAAAEYELVVMIHGHGGNHNEWGGYDVISNGLAENGQIVVTLDFPGCGASTESFQLNTMTNMMQDVLDVIAYMQENYSVVDVDGFGYSMGGRIILQLLAEEKFMFDSVELVAPAEDLEDMKNLFGGAEAWETMKATANENGYADFTTVYGQQQELSKEWFEDLEAWPDGLAEAAAAVYSGPAIVVYAVDDAAVAPSVSQGVADILGATVYKTWTEGHSYSFYGSNPVTLAIANGVSLAFFLNVEDDMH